MKNSHEPGRLHPITDIIRQISSIFVDMGFEIADGPQIEDQWHNFDALNVPKDHPARDMQDTFFVRSEKDAEGEPKVMRTHTSNMQIRFMEKFLSEGKEPPFKIIVPGKVFRNEATDATHEAQFYQFEGLVVGEGISLAHLKGTLEEFFRRFYQDDSIEARFRPGYFPFVEPGVEVDLSCQICDRDGSYCPVCKGIGWREVLGAGMVHPNVLRNVGLDPEKYSGFAFGAGIDRLAIMKYNIPDVRLFYTGDLRLHYGLESTTPNS